MKEDITRRMERCPACGQYFEPIDKEAVCEACTPLWWKHNPFRIEKVGNEPIDD